jgi:hypothetical protein
MIILNVKIKNNIFILIDSTKDFPNQGIALKRFVITVAPQRLI